MKKLLSLMMLMLLCTSAWAATVTMAYSGSSNGNMTEGNNAESVGLDADLWSVVADKGGQSIMPGLNKAGEIRLYGHANGGNTMTVNHLGGGHNQFYHCHLQKRSN